VNAKQTRQLLEQTRTLEERAEKLLQLAKLREQEAGTPSDAAADGKKAAS